MYTCVARWVAFACVLGTLYVESVVGQIKGMKKDFRKSNKIAHFMGKRTNTDLDGFMDGYLGDVDTGIPYRGTQDAGYPLFPVSSLAATEETLDTYPYRRSQAGQPVKVAHVFGRHTTDDLDNIAYPYMVNNEESSYNHGGPDFR